MAGIDGRLFGRPESTEVVQPYQSQIGGTDAVPAPSVEVDAASLSTGASTQQGLAVQQSYSPLEPTMLESAGAAVHNWDTLNVFRSLNKPEFEPDGADAPDLYTQLKYTPFKLTPAENTRLKEAGTAAEREWLLKQYEDSRQAGTVASEHAVVAGLTTILDPAYLVMAGPITRTAGLLTGASARVAGGVMQGAVAAGIGSVASDVAPRTVGEEVFMVLANMAGGAAMVNGGKVVARDPDFPDVLPTLEKPHMRLVEPARYVTDDFGTQVKVRDAVFEEIPKPLRAGNTVVDPVEVATAIDNQLTREAKTWGQKFGEAISWNTNKTLRNLSNDGDEIADILTDNNLAYGQNSVESIKIGVQRDLQQHQASFEQKLRAAMAEDGYGTWKYLMSNAETRAAQARLEREITHEMLRREQLTRQGRPITFEPSDVSPRVKAMADDLDKLGFRSVDELQAAGVSGSENIQKLSGYFHRTWSSSSMENVLQKFRAAGQTEAQAMKSLTGLLRGSLRRANGWDAELAKDVAHAIITRTLRKGQLDDGIMASNLGAGAAAQVRDMLEGSGLSAQRIDRVVQAITGQVDEAGKANYLKHRVDLDYTASVVVNGELVRVTDMIESNIATLTDRYIDGVAAQVAFARKGMTKPSDITALRQRYIKGAPDAKKAADMFDNVIAHLQGKPVGQDMNELLRNMAGYNRMITLGASGLWQATEYAKMMQRYGMLATSKYMLKEMPGFKQLMASTGDQAKRLKDILADNSSQQLRLRPYIARFEDNFEIPQTSRTSSFVQQGAQLVPYLNGMKYIHAHQARVHANLLVDVMRRAAKGDADAVSHLKSYGIESQGMDKLRADIVTHGFNVDKWTDATWMSVRPALNKMTDESVLHARMGDMPAFALMDPVGKFIFTYRSFVLTAHNKILAGTSAREGLGATSLLMVYQYPLSMLATQVNTVASGKPPLNQDDLLTKSIGQMGALGLGSEISNLMFGNKSNVGAPGLIPADRLYKAAQSGIGFITGGTEGAKAMQDAAAITPFVNIIPGSKALQHLAD